MINLALGKNLPDGLKLVELSKTIAKSLFTYDANNTYSISDVDLISLFYKYYFCSDQEITDQIFKYYSDIRLQNSGVVNGELTFPKLRRIEKENYDAFIKLIRTSGVAPENEIFIKTLFSKYEHAKSLLGAPGIIKTFIQLYTITNKENDIEKKTIINRCFPVILNAAMKDSEEAQELYKNEPLKKLLQNVLATSANKDSQILPENVLPLNRKKLINDFDGYVEAALCSGDKARNFFNNCLLTDLLLNSLHPKIETFHSLEEMLNCILKITPLNQNYLAVVNIEFEESNKGNEAKRIAAEIFHCRNEKGNSNDNNLDHCFILIPVKDVHTYLSDKLSINGVIPGLYSRFDIILEWDTPEKLAKKPLNHEAFKNQLDTSTQQTKLKLLIPQPDTRIELLCQKYSGNESLNITTGFQNLHNYAQKTILHFTNLLKSIGNYFSSEPQNKVNVEKPELEKSKNAGEVPIKAPHSSQAFFPPSPPSISSPNAGTLESSATTPTLSSPDSLCVTETTYDQKSEKVPTRSAATWKLPNENVNPSDHPPSSTPADTILKIGRRAKS